MRRTRDDLHQDYRRTEDIEIDGVVNTFAELSTSVRMPYLTGLRGLRATAAETLVVEDSSRGLSSAVAAGIECVVVHNDFTAAQDLSLDSHRIDTLAELRDIVLRAF